MTWIFLRHGETVCNVITEKIKVSGEQTEHDMVKLANYQIPLTENGIEQARRSGVALRERYGIFDQAIHTGYIRSKDTLENILKAYSENERVRMKVSRNFHLRERDSGYPATMMNVETERLFPWLKEHKQIHGLFSRPPGGESIADVISRVERGLSPLLENATRENILFVVHGWTMATVRFLLEDWSYKEADIYLSGPSPINCSGMIYTFDPESNCLVYQNNECFC